MLRKTTALALAAILGTAGPLAAAEHTVMMMGDGFFPDALYIEDGDTVRFVNATDTVQQAVAADASWSTGDVAVDGAFVMTVETGMHQVFLANGVAAITGTVFFGEAPLD